MPLPEQIAITGIGLCAPNGCTLKSFRDSLLAGTSGVVDIVVPHIGKVPAGVCTFDESKYQSRADRRKGTRAASLAIYCASEAILDSGLDWPRSEKSRIGIVVGVTEHGNVSTELQLEELKGYGNDITIWSNYHNPRTVANNPAGETSLRLGITGPHLTVGAACAAGNAGLIHGAQLLALGDVDVALAGGVSECIRSFGVFASFRSQRALATHADCRRASRPFDSARNGIVPAEGGCIFIMERLGDAVRRGARIYAVLAGYGMNSDAADLVNPLPTRQAECIQNAIAHARVDANDIAYVGSHATGTEKGDVAECDALRSVFGRNRQWMITNTKSHIGHGMGAAGAFEVAALLLAMHDGVIHATINLDSLDPRCADCPIVASGPSQLGDCRFGIVNSFGMLGLNSCVVLSRPLA